MFVMPGESGTKFFKQWEGAVLAVPKPLPGKVSRPKDDIQQGLF
jgi:hypothetical protein